MRSDKISGKLFQELIKFVSYYFYPNLDNFLI